MRHDLMSNPTQTGSPTCFQYTVLRLPQIPSTAAAIVLVRAPDEALVVEVVGQLRPHAHGAGGDPILVPHTSYEVGIYSPALYCSHVRLDINMHPPTRYNNP